MLHQTMKFSQILDREKILDFVIQACIRMFLPLEVQLKVKTYNFIRIKNGLAASDLFCTYFLTQTLKNANYFFKSSCYSKNISSGVFQLYMKSSCLLNILHHYLNVSLSLRLDYYQIF